MGFQNFIVINKIHHLKTKNGEFSTNIKITIIIQNISQPNLIYYNLLTLRIVPVEIHKFVVSFYVFNNRVLFSVTRGNTYSLRIASA